MLIRARATALVLLATSIPIIATATPGAALECESRDLFVGTAVGSDGGVELVVLSFMQAWARCRLFPVHDRAAGLLEARFFSPLSPSRVEEVGVSVFPLPASGVHAGNTHGGWGLIQSGSVGGPEVALAYSEAGLASQLPCAQLGPPLVRCLVQPLLGAPDGLVIAGRLGDAAIVAFEYDDGKDPI